MESLAEQILAEASQLKSEQSGFISTWQECADHALPLRRLGFEQLQSTPYKPDRRLQSDVAVDALQVNASGMLSWTTPSRENWFDWQPADSIESTEVADWLADCTTRAHKLLANSNFYHAMHLLYLDRGAFGTVGLFCEKGRNQALNFKCWHTGTFVCAENEEGRVDRVFRYFNLTSDQAVKKFGDAAPDQCKKDVAENKRHNKHAFLHGVFPRQNAGQVPGPLGKPFACVYIHCATKTLVMEDGYDSLPVFVTRWLKFSDDCPIGVSPAMLSIADILGSDYLEKLLAKIGQLKVEPRTITKTGNAGTIDLGPKGVTQVMDMKDKPEVWADPSDFQSGEMLLNRVDNRIRRAFHVPLFEQFATIDDRVTATLVRAKQGEQLARVSPAFTLLTTDLIDPLLERVFMVLYLGGYFKPAPREAFVQDAAGQVTLLFPKVIQVSRMAKAIEEAKQLGFTKTVEMFAPFFEAQPSLLMNWDLDTAMRDAARGNGVPGNYLRPKAEVEQMLEAQAQAAQAQQAQEAALQMATKNPELAMQAAQQMEGAQP